MGLMRWDPVDVDRFRDDFSRYWNRFRDEWSNLDLGRPRTRFQQTEDGYWVEFELPGVNPSQVDIEIDGDSITVSGQFPPFPATSEEGSESFHSTVNFPTEVDPETAEATFHHGLLRVKAERAGGRRRHIPIKTMS